ncbi:hypothetical protein KFE25_005646 [Diacronema lutheri]|uniref:Uncharacterized protein n=1 Tax=Diacronema lutheri TaxID=2081491 RepID=A0A8J5XC97_DIALT|nr:hypothetical protein KFE25_005646 [Diacronema lutheri]
MLRIFAFVGVLLAAAPGALAVLSAAPPATTVYSRLQGVRVTRASDGAAVQLTSQWRKDVAFGLGGERAVVCFLRHFG